MSRLIDADALVKKFAHPPELMYTNVVLDEIRSAPTVGGWISVKDRLPKERQDVLLKFPSNMAVGFFVEGGWMVNSGGNWTTDVCEDDEVPQYWMPLPEPPKEENDNEDAQS